MRRKCPKALGQSRSELAQAAGWESPPGKRRAPAQLRRGLIKKNIPGLEVQLMPRRRPALYITKHRSPPPHTHTQGETKKGLGLGEMAKLRHTPQASKISNVKLVGSILEAKGGSGSQQKSAP